LLRSSDHEIVIGTSIQDTRRLITSIGPAADKFQRLSRTKYREMRLQNGAALLSPALARKFPFFAPLWTCPEVSFAFSGLVSGEIVNDH
jgi:hypothetical protein